MLQIGDKVYIEDSGQIDIGFLAWAYIKDHREAVVKQQMPFIALGVDLKGYTPRDVDYIYALEWAEQFSGGHNCHGHCIDGQGQFVAAKHLSLNFEESREVNTIPNIGPTTVESI